MCLLFFSRNYLSYDLNTLTKYLPFTQKGALGIVLDTESIQVRICIFMILNHLCRGRVALMKYATDL